MNVYKHECDQSRHIYGVDFSGAATAGDKTWISKGIFTGKTLLIEDCYKAETLPGSGKDRNRCLTALRNFIKGQENGAFGLDCPFGLPKLLAKHKPWEEFVLVFASSYESPEHFKEACITMAGGIELKRETDRERKAPFSPYNLRLYRQTYFGISGVLSPLVREQRACVLPMQEGLPDRPWIFEVCPASTLKTCNLYFPYKGRTHQHRNARFHLLKGMERNDCLRLLKPGIAKTIVEDRGGDALDSVIAALATSRALLNGGAISSGFKDSYTIEGYIYV